MKNKKKKIIFGLALIICMCALFTLFNYYYNDTPKKVTMSMKVLSERDDQYSVYYDLDGKENWNEEQVDRESYTKVNVEKKLAFYIPSESKNIRIDFGSKKGDFELSDLEVHLKNELKIPANEINNYIQDQNDLNLNVVGDKVKVTVTGNDPYIVINNFDNIVDQVFGRPTYVNIIMSILSLLLGLLTVYSLKGLRKSILFVKKSFSNKKLIVNLAKNDFKQKYISSYLGVIWGFIQPLVTIAVYWFVIQVGLRQGSVGEVPFILWFISGIIPWFFFTDALSSCTNVFMEYSYLVKKVVFKIETLPVIKILSVLFVQGFFILFLIGVSSVYGYYPDLYTLQVIYYLFAMIVLVYSVTIFTSAVVLFFRDLSQIITIIVNVGFWATPIGWNITMLPEVIQKLFKLNPMFYIVTGYRDSFVDKIFFWDRPYHTIYFWCFCFVMLLIGVKVFNKLRPHFSDVI